MPSDLIKAAFDVRFLRSRQDVQIFDNSLGLYMAEFAETPSREDLVGLFDIFHDDTEQHEVMYGLVHLIECFPLRLWLPVFLAALPNFEKQGAADWARRILARLLMDEKEARPTLPHAIASLPPKAADCAKRILADLSAKAKRPSAIPASWVLRQLSESSSV